MIKAIAVIQERILKNFLKRSNPEKKRVNKKIIPPIINITPKLRFSIVC